MTNEVIENIVETTSTGKTEGFFHFLSSPIVNITALCITFILILGIIVVFVCGTKIKNKLKTEFYELLYKDIYEILLEKADLAAGETYDEALAALVMLGFSQQASGRALKSLFASQPTLTVEQAIKQALKMM